MIYGQDPRIANTPDIWTRFGMLNASITVDNTPGSYRTVLTGTWETPRNDTAAIYNTFYTSVRGHLQANQTTIRPPSMSRSPPFSG
jgi:hypothetical protein